MSQKKPFLSYLGYFIRVMKNGLKKCNSPNRFNTILISLPANFILGLDRLIVKLIWNCTGPRIVETILKQKIKVRRLRLPNFKTYYNAIVTKTVWYWQKDIEG
jgi:hypothetical protein